jgi:site-specific recombinase XerD
MTSIRLEYVHSYVDRHGKPRHYFRRAGLKKIPLPGLPGSSEFMEAYQAALAGDKALRVEIGAANTMPGTVDALVVAYYKSTEFTQDLGEGTQKARRSIIERFRAQHGEKRVAKIERDHVVAMMAAIGRRHAKRNWFKAIRGLMKFAVSIGMRRDDPTDGIKQAKVQKSAGLHTWTDDEIKRYRDHWPLGTQQRLAMELALETTSRRADVTRIGVQHIRSARDRLAPNGRLDLRHTKNNSDALIPITNDLRAAIDACPTKHLTFLHTKAGAPRSPKALGGDFRQWCDAAGLPKRCTIHGLRKGGARRLAEAGASTREIMSVTGHKTLSEVERYTEAAERARLAESAMIKLGQRKP